MADNRIPLEQNPRAQSVLDRLRVGPASTTELQNELSLVHVARQIWELRKWYGWGITTRRLSNRVAVYVLGEKVEVKPPVSPLCPKCASPLRDIRQTIAGGWIAGRCRTHGKFTMKLADS